MSDIAIRIENLGKRYRYGGVAPISYNLRQDITDWAKGFFGSNSMRHRSFRQVREQHIAESPDYFWALKDINLEIKRGEVVGIIGRNGAGKTTLLKILSRITTPTTGKVTYHGRVASLLEVGTGFHRELTGRENIFLNGSILGMKRQEIARKLDEITAFAEIDKFLDTPVKFYSSGMYVRLAFAVAAHLEPEILLVDEVLAVGDAEFQKKCLGKMAGVAKTGRTVLFVSHNMAAVSELCTRAVLVRSGVIAADGPPPQVIAGYLGTGSEWTKGQLAARKDRQGSGRMRFTSVRVLVDGQEAPYIQSGRDVTFELSYEAREAIHPQSVRFGISILTAAGVKFLVFDSASTGFETPYIPARGVLRCSVPKFPLTSGVYRALLFAVINGETVDRIEDAVEFEVVSGMYPRVGYLNLDHNWRLSSEHMSAVAPQLP